MCSFMSVQSAANALFVRLSSRTFSNKVKVANARLLVDSSDNEQDYSDGSISRKLLERVGEGTGTYL